MNEEGLPGWKNSLATTSSSIDNSDTFYHVHDTNSSSSNFCNNSGDSDSHSYTALAFSYTTALA